MTFISPCLHTVWSQCAELCRDVFSLWTTESTWKSCTYVSVKIWVHVYPFMDFIERCFFLKIYVIHITIVMMFTSLQRDLFLITMLKRQPSVIMMDVSSHDSSIWLQLTTKLPRPTWACTSQNMSGTQIWLPVHHLTP